MSKLNSEDYIVMRYIGFGRGQKNASAKDAEGFNCYYDRSEMTDEQFETCLRRLEAAGMILRQGTIARPTDKVRALRKGCRTGKSRLLEFLNLPNDHEDRFRAAFYAVEVPDEPYN
jgi:hypothetical protein